MLSWDITRELDSDECNLLEKAAANVAADAANYVARQIAKVQANAPAVAALIKLLPFDEYGVKAMLQGYDTRIKREDLSKIRKACGRLKVYNKYADDANHVNVTVTPEKYPGLQFTYRKAYRGDKKCKIVKTEQRYESYSLVCEES